MNIDYVMAAAAATLPLSFPFVSFSKYPPIPFVLVLLSLLFSRVNLPKRGVRGEREAKIEYTYIPM